MSSNRTSAAIELFAGLVGWLVVWPISDAVCLKVGVHKYQQSWRWGWLIDPECWAERGGAGGEQGIAYSQLWFSVEGELWRVSNLRPPTSAFLVVSFLTERHSPYCCSEIQWIDAVQVVSRLKMSSAVRVFENFDSYFSDQLIGLSTTGISSHTFFCLLFFGSSEINMERGVLHWFILHFIL